MPLFHDNAHSLALVKHGMDVIAKATEHENRGKVPVLTVDQPLFAITKKIPWSWLDVYGDNFCLLQRFATNVQIMIVFNVFNELGKQFTETSDNIFALDTKVILFENAIDTITRAEAMGREQHETFVNHTSLYKPFNE